MFHQKNEPYKYVLPIKNWVDWIATRQEKNVKHKSGAFLEEMPRMFS